MEKRKLVSYNVIEAKNVICFDMSEYGEILDYIVPKYIVIKAYDDDSLESFGTDNLSVRGLVENKIFIDFCYCVDIEQAKAMVKIVLVDPLKGVSDSRKSMAENIKAAKRRVLYDLRSVWMDMSSEALEYLKGNE